MYLLYLYITNIVIFCNNPFTIPLSGNLDVYCFDKTGTLTSTKVLIKGIVYNEIDGIIYNNSELNNETRMILAGCIDCVLTTKNRVLI